MKGHWENQQPNGEWVRCFDLGYNPSAKELETHFSLNSIHLKHRFVTDHEHVFNKCECGKVKSEVTPSKTKDNKER